MNELFNNVRKWAEERNINKAEPSKQFLKVTEELGEIAEAMAKNNHEQLVDSLGDITVTLIILAQQHNLNLEYCLNEAYNVIKNRKGKTIDGVFVKQEDLKHESN